MIAKNFNQAASHVYCTYFDTGFLSRGLVMLRSLRRYDPSSIIVVLAIGEVPARVLHDVFGSELRVIESEALHSAVPVLRVIREQRSTWAFYATQKPALAMFTMGSEILPESVVYVDADTWFFADPAPIFQEIGGASVGISPHRFHAANRNLNIYGKYNAGWVYWCNNQIGRECLADWRDDCLEWCSEQNQPDGRFMNQGYLNRWPERYSNVHVVWNPGANLAPWNVDGHVLERDGDAVTVDGSPLIFYHFSGLRRDAGRHWYSSYPKFEQFDLVNDTIYRPYITALDAEGRRLADTYGIEGVGAAQSVDEFAPRVRLGP